MTKFIIGVDAFSDPNAQEKEFITHTQFPKFFAEIIFVESQDQIGFSLDSLKVIWNEKCEKKDLDLAIKDARKAVEFYTEKTMSLMEDEHDA